MLVVYTIVHVCADHASVNAADISEFQQAATQYRAWVVEPCTSRPHKQDLDTYRTREHTHTLTPAEKHARSDMHTCPTRCAIMARGMKLNMGAHNRKLSHLTEGARQGRAGSLAPLPRS